MKYRDIIRDGVRYCAYSDRGKQVAQEIARERIQKTRTPISLILALGFGLAAHTFGV